MTSRRAALSGWTISTSSKSTEGRMALATSKELVESSLVVTAREPRMHRAHDAAGTVARVSSIWEKAIVVVLLVAVVVTALACGAVEPWSVALFELMVILLVVLWAGQALSGGRLVVSVPAAAVPIGLLVLLGVVQSLAFTGSAGKRSSLSLDVEATRSAVLAILFLLICFLASATFLAGRKRIRIIVRCLVIYGLAMAVFALVQHLSQGGRIYWLRPQSEGVSWFGPFVNHSHYAGYIALLIPLPIALLTNKAVRAEERFLFGFAAGIMGLSLVVSLSRGGMIAMGSELLFLVVAGSGSVRRLIAGRDPQHAERSSNGSRLKSLAALAVIVISIGAGLLWLGPEPLANRIARGNGTASGHSESFHESRGWIWRDSIRVFEAHPLIGAGMGAFETAFPAYSKGDGSLLVSQSHNDYLQILADCGILGGILAVWFIVGIGRVIIRGLRSRDPFPRSLSLGCGAAIFGMLVHSVFDFNLQVPSTALLFLIICAIAHIAGGRRHGNRRGEAVGANVAAASAGSPVFGGN